MPESSFTSLVGSSLQTGRPRRCYVHIPFCRHRCGYCNFTLVAGRDDLINAYLEAVQVEISRLPEMHEIDSLFFGGGTPSHLSPRQIEELMMTIRSRFSLANGCEFSVEVNPSDVQPALVDVLANHGVTRISLGAQSFDRKKLKLLERDHTPDEIVQAVELLRNRFTSISLDLIFAVPGESLATWQADLSAALRLAPHHVSTYGLTFEKGTSFWTSLSKGRVSEIDEELQRQMYLAAIDDLSAAGYRQYEISNFAQPGHACRHNEAYWKGDQFFGFGPGAARFVDGVREVNHRSTTTYIKRMLNGESPVAEREKLAPEDSARERLVFAMRRLEGVNRERFYEQTSFRIEQLVGEELPRLFALGVVEDDGLRIKLTRKGLLVSDSIATKILG